MNKNLKRKKLVKDSLEQGTKILDQMTLETLKSKYEAALKKNIGQRNEYIETLISNVEKK